jgi:hypothetical protein
MPSIICRASRANTNTDSYNKWQKKKGTYQLTSLKLKS